MHHVCILHPVAPAGPLLGGAAVAAAARPAAATAPALCRAAHCRGCCSPVLRTQVGFVHHQVPRVDVAGRGEGVLVGPEQARLKRLVCGHEGQGGGGASMARA